MTELPKEIKQRCFSKILTYIDYREIHKIATELVNHYLDVVIITAVIESKDYKQVQNQHSLLQLEDTIVREQRFLQW